jgi:CubicO group peptidase (beta-lactamase class C family)
LTGSCLRRRVDRLLSLDLVRMQHQPTRTALLAATIILTSLGTVAAAPPLNVIALATGAERATVALRTQLLGTPLLHVGGGYARGEAGARLDGLFDRFEAAGFSGAILVARQDVVLLHRGFGEANRRTGERFRPDTRFNAGAIAKNLTAAAILRLEQQGRLHLNDRVSKYIGALPGVKGEATLFHLLTHTGGLTPLNRPVYSADRGAFVRELRAAPADFAPGTDQRHTDIGYSTLAMVVEIVSGQPYEQFVRTELLQPAGLRATAFEPDVPYAGMAVEYASMHDLQSEVDRRPYVWGRRGAMGAVTTVEDLYRWHRAVESDLFSAETRARMFDVQMPNRWRSRTGLGWESRTSDRGTIVHHVLSGWPGNSVELMHEPETGLVIALMINDRVDWTYPRYDAIARYALAAPAEFERDPAVRILLPIGN